MAVNPEKPHKFEPRDRGSPLACRWCGAAIDNWIHTKGRGIADIVPMERRGQALIEMALVTPILLLMITGVFAIGWLLLDVSQVNHAAQEAAVAGAMNPGDSCGVAIVTANAIYPNPLDSAECDIQGQYITVTISHLLPLNRISPIWGDLFNVTATARAVLR